MSRAVASPILPMPDPPIVSGSYRALPRTSGGYAVIDERRGLGDKLVRIVATEGAARAAVSELGAAEWLLSHGVEPSRSA